jgi:hypothetical protein
VAGEAILPFPPKAPFSAQRDYCPKGSSPCGVIRTWQILDGDIGTRYLRLRQAKHSDEQIQGTDGGHLQPFWLGRLLPERTPIREEGRGGEAGAKYPDSGCNFEVFTDEDSLELETLGPLRNLEPGETAEHIERWWLFKDVEAGESESWIDSEILARVQAVR